MYLFEGKEGVTDDWNAMEPIFDIFKALYRLNNDLKVYTLLNKLSIDRLATDEWWLRLASSDEFHNML